MCCTFHQRGPGIQRQFIFKTKKRMQTHIMFTFDSDQKRFAISDYEYLVDSDFGNELLHIKQERFHLT